MRLTRATARIGAVSWLVVTHGMLLGSARAGAPFGEGRSAPVGGPDAHVGTGTPPTDAELAGRIDRSTIERAAVARSPGLQAAEHRVRALAEESSSEGGLPAPELMVQLWQIPLSRPYAIGDAGMAMVGLQQSFPAPGSLGAKADAKAHEARAEAAMALIRARDLIRSVDHAFVDYTEATSRHRVHVDHQQVMQRVVEVARARYAASGSLADVAQAETELARLEADLVTDRSGIETARARLNGLLSRDPAVPLGEPVQPEVSGMGLPPEQVVASARAHRPDVQAADEKREAAAAQARGSEREAKIPSFTVAALYFAPVGPMPVHGYGVNLSMTLPWLWGARSHRAAADTEMLAAERSEAEDTRVRVATEVGGAAGAAKGAERRYATLLEKALPASQRALDASQAGYVASRGDLVSLLMAERSVVDVRMELVMARATLDHALVDLDWAAGMRLPRQPVMHAEGADHVH
jgi:outer membrane protein TolC